MDINVLVFVGKRNDLPREFALAIAAIVEATEFLQHRPLTASRGVD
jgi:hypothetical protein